jgi:subtilisin family serine protease
MTSDPIAAPAQFRAVLGGATGRGVRVGVIDTGWDRSLADPRVLPGAGFVGPESDFTLAPSGDDHDRLGHGTACADLVLRMAPQAEIVPIRVFGGRLETSPEVLAAALEWAADRALPLVSLSLGTTLERARAPLLAACDRAVRAGAIIVATAPDRAAPPYPAAFPQVIGVDADRFPSPWHFRYRPGDAVECTAAGHEQRLRWLGGREEVRSGSSFATPHIAGIVALVLERHPGASLARIREILARLASP